MKITVFGSARPVAGDADYEQAYRLGKLIAANGAAAITGGYGGTMSAVSAGASAAGGHVIGVTCRQIRDWSGSKANQWVKEEVLCATLPERIERLIHLCDAAIALPGGPGTLAEISLFWNLAVIDAIPGKPLVMVGSGWKTVFETMRADLGAYAPPENWRLLHYADSVEEAFTAAQQLCQ
jgi:uncharacterized protein (TIGR00730 family)